MLEHIRRDNEEANAPRSLPVLQTDPLLGSFVPPTKSDITPASDTIPKIAVGLWLTHIERSGNRTVLTAKLRQAGTNRVVAEFVIQCERVESVALPVEMLVAHGPITFQGSAGKGACGKLTIPLHDARIFFDENVQIRSTSATPESTAGLFVGDRLMWEPMNAPVASPRPVSLEIPN